jgi:hypothetical protein
MLKALDVMNLGTFPRKCRPARPPVEVTGRLSSDYRAVE